MWSDVVNIKWQPSNDTAMLDQVAPPHDFAEGYQTFSHSRYLVCTAVAIWTIHGIIIITDYVYKNSLFHCCWYILILHFMVLSGSD